MGKRKKQQPQIDVLGILNSRVTVKQGTTLIKMHPFEASARALAAKAIGGDMRAAKKFLLACLAAGVVARPELVDNHQYDLTIPHDWITDEWMEMYTRLGPPPWPGDRNGLIGSS